MSVENRCPSFSEDGRRCHGNVGHPGTHWAGASRIWSDVETLARPLSGGELRTKWQQAAQRISEECLPMLFAKETELKREGHRIIGAMLPAHLDPGPYDGDDATDAPAQIMGYPVIWGSQTGLIVAADSHLARIGEHELQDFSPRTAPR